ncbi:aminotransferase V [Pedobacter sp. HMWF019]|uniref:aminotransferase class V-fold PLP-dependent enzyme n=1 Tax=Pedobacter sp. HMWF019 TaxID=2056856 RepID=UPI000D367101|nr:aminotransferase class V-fold PLP-dependent enzyme [Pedobacter sp. HMWF019]PTS92948.1 aminotransferase V [Pedobacter sp. HMWF019]
MKLEPIHNEEIQTLRNQTIGTSQLIHFNNAGSSLPPDVVVDTVIDYLKEEALAGGYETEAKYIDRINGVYDQIARLINADRDEIAVFENASAAWCTAFKGLSFKDGDEIITTEMEYVTNLIGLVDMQNADGIKVKVIPNDEGGNFSVPEFEKAINAKTRLIMVTHVSSSGGSIMPVEEIGNLAEKHQILYLVDACQSAGQLPLDVKKIKCDMLSATGRKYMRAPRGTGFLFVKKSSQDFIKPILLDFQAAGNVSLTDYTLRKDARRFELYEKNRALTLGFGKAIEYAMNIGLERIWHRIERLSVLMRRNLAEIPGIVVRDAGDRLSGIVTFSVKDIESSEVKLKLAEIGINVSVGGSQATPIYMDKNRLSTVVRASVHYYNTEEEIYTLCEELSAMILTR